MPAKITINNATVAHADLLSALHASSFAGQGRDPWDAETMRRAVTTAGGFALIASISEASASDTPLGFAIGRAIAGEAELFSIGAPPERRRGGVGGMLLTGFHREAVARGAEKAFLEVAEDNVAAIALYRAHGYRQVGRRESYYRGPSGPVDALVLSVSLPQRGLPATQSD